MSSIFQPSQLETFFQVLIETQLLTVPQQRLGVRVKGGFSPFLHGEVNYLRSEWGGSGVQALEKTKVVILAVLFAIRDLGPSAHLRECLVCRILSCTYFLIYILFFCHILIALKLGSP